MPRRVASESSTRSISPLAEDSELPLKLDSRDGLNLLKMECTRSEERFRNAQFPTIATQRGGVQNYREFLFGGIACQQQGRAHLRGNPKNPSSTLHRD